MTREYIAEKVQMIFRDVFDDDELIITDATNSDDIEDWDSLEHINLVAAVEKEFDIKFSMGQVVTMKNTQDAACLGAAITAGYGIGIYDSIQETASKFAKIDKVYNPNPENREVYDCLLHKYDVFIEATKGYTEELAKIK